MNPLAIEAGAAALSTGLGMATAGWNDRRQLKQQQKLQDMQIRGQREMSNYNQQLALDMWEATNYKAQMEQLQKAGLNPGLIYAKGGTSGTTQVTPGNVSGADAPKGGGELGMGMQLGLQAAMQQAQIELVKAQTEKTKVETTKTGGVDTQAAGQQIAESQSRIELLKQSTNNAQIQNAILEMEKDITRINRDIQSATTNDVITTIRSGAEKITGEAEQQRNAGKISTEQYNQITKQIQQTTIEQAGRIAIQKLQMQATEQQIKNAAGQLWEIYNNANNENRKINNQDEQIALQKLQTEFNTNDSQQVKQIVDIWKTIIDGISGAIKALK